MRDEHSENRVDVAFEANMYYKRMLKSTASIRRRADMVPSIAVVLGSGLGHFGENKHLNIVAEVPYSEIEGFPRTTVAGHQGKLIFAEYAGKNLVIMQGRVHFYEGYSMQDVVYPLRVLHLLGAGTVILTNAVGAINPDFKPGDLMVVRDHISFMVPSPLIGENVSELGVRFSPMVDAYDPELQKLVMEIGQELGLTVHNGVYMQLTGPQYETPAEIRACRILGADTVGMSTAVETIAARHMGMRVCTINCVTNMAAGVGDHTFSHTEVLETAGRGESGYTVLMEKLIERMPC